MRYKSNYVRLLDKSLINQDFVDSLKELEGILKESGYNISSDDLKEHQDYVIIERRAKFNLVDETSGRVLEKDVTNIKNRPLEIGKSWVLNAKIPYKLALTRIGKTKFRVWDKSNPKRINEIYNSLREALSALMSYVNKYYSH